MSAGWGAGFLVGGGQKLWSSNNHYTLRQIASRNVRKFNITATDYLLSLNAQSEEQPLLDLLGNIFYSLVDEMTTGIADNDLLRFVLQSRSLDYPISLPFMPRHELMQIGLWAKCNVSYNLTKRLTFKARCKFMWVCGKGVSPRVRGNIMISN